MIAQEGARERQFRTASAAKKRVLIAKDVLAQLQARRIQTGRVSWIERLTLPENTENLELREVLRSAPACSACALGALLLCTVRMHDAIEVDDLFDCGDVNEVTLFSYLRDFFSSVQLRLIEATYEQGSGYVPWDDVGEDVTRDEIARAQRFSRQYRGKGARLRAIMENLIKNKGTFVP